MSQLVKTAPRLVRNVLIRCMSETPSPSSMSPRYRPSNLEKKILVWTKKYKSVEEVPQFVSPELIERARSQARIRISNILMVLTALASIGAIMMGKNAVKRGESVHQQNLDWHKEYNESYKQKEEAAKTS